MHVSFYFDPICPWCWETAGWLIDVRNHRPINIDWRPFSLGIKNEDLTGSESQKARQLEGRRALRAVEFARADSGPAVVEKLYLEMGRRWHHDGDRVFDIAAIVAAVGLSPIPPLTTDDPTWDAPIEAAMATATAVVGDDVGVPIIVFEGDDPVGFFGPVISPAPAGDEAAQLFDHLAALGRVPGFYELKRGRPVS